MPTRPPSPDPSGAANAESGNPFAGLGAGLGAGLDFFQDWLKAAGSALPHMQGHAASQPGAPSMSAWTMPTLDPAELEKRIQDLKTVQFWLEQNARMVAMTIQGLEVQRMTLSTLQGMNVSMDALRESLKTRPQAQAPAEPAPSPPPRPAPASSWSMPRDEGVSGSDDAPPDTPAQAANDESPDLINPMRWWDTLTQQFTHLASQAAQTVGDSVGGSMDIIKQAQSATGVLGAKAAPAAAGTSAKGKTGAGAKPTAKAGKKPARKAAAKSAKRHPADKPGSPSGSQPERT
jgi:hypothetical protein